MSVRNCRVVRFSVRLRLTHGATLLILSTHLQQIGESIYKKVFVEVGVRTTAVDPFEYQQGDRAQFVIRWDKDVG